MARSILLSFLAIIMVLVTISSLALADDLFDGLLPPDSALAPDDSDSDISFAPEASLDPGLLFCASKMTLDCASEIMSNDFFAVHVEGRCCKQLIQMGKTCNDLIVNDVLAELDLEKRASKVHNRSDHLWNKCLDVLSNH